MRKVIALVFVVAFLFACSKKVLINVKKPATYNVSDLKRIAILDFNGPKNSGEIIASKFTDKLWKTQYFTIMERKELEKILDEHALQMTGIIDDETVVQFGKLLGVDGIIVGDVTTYSVSSKRGRGKVKEQVWKGEYETDKDGKIIYEKTLLGRAKKKKYVEEYVERTFVNQTVTVAVNFRLVSIETGEIRATDSNTRSSSKKYYPHKDKIPPSEQTLDALSDNVLNKFIPIITPHDVRISKEFEEDNDQVDLGIEFAQKNLWDKAVEIWEAELKINPANSAALYNMGIAAEVIGELDQAEQYYEKALAVEPKELYMDALSHIRNRKIEQQKLQEQLH